VGSAQVHGLQQRVAGRWQCQPPPVGVLTDLGDQARSHELTQGDLDRGWPDGPAAVGERGGETVKAVRAASSEGCERAGGGGPQLCLRMKIDGRPPVILTTLEADVSLPP
jgi:hypothetical protein